MPGTDRWETQSQDLERSAFVSHLGIIEVNISLTKKDFYVLTVQDNGIGLPTHVDIQSASTLGLQLFWSLTQ